MIVEQQQKSPQRSQMVNKMATTTKRIESQMFTDKTY